MWSRSSSGTALQIAISRLPFRIHACSFFTTPCRDFSSSVLTSPFAAVSLLLDNTQHTQKENVSTHTHKMHASERASEQHEISSFTTLRHCTHKIQKQTRLFFLFQIIPGTSKN
jgi:hypothetical protein